MTTAICVQAEGSNIIFPSQHPVATVVPDGKQVIDILRTFESTGQYHRKPTKMH